jgi:hypothetical protein
VSFATVTLCVASQRVFLLFILLSTQSGNFWIHPRIVPEWRGAKSVASHRKRGGIDLAANTTQVRREN